MCLFIVAGRGSSGLPPSVMSLILFTFANYTYHGEDLKNSPTVNSVRQTLDIEKFCSILIRFCILSDPPPSIYTCDLLSSYSVMNTPNKTCWEKIRGGEIEKEKKIKSLFKKKPMTQSSQKGGLRNSQALSHHIWLPNLQMINGIAEGVVTAVSTHTSNGISCNCYKSWRFVYKRTRFQMGKWKKTSEGLIKYLLSPHS